MSAALQYGAPSHMTLDEFLAWDSGNDSRWQLIDGVPVAMAPPREGHGGIQAEVARLLGNHVLETARSCRVVTEGGVVPRLSMNENFRVPDVLVTCASPTNEQMVPDPVLLIEIMSPNNKAATRANLWAYTTIPSVQEILVLQSTRIEADLLRRQPDGTWPDGPQRIAVEGTVELASIGFAVPLAALYRTTFLAG